MAIPWLHFDALNSSLNASMSMRECQHADKRWTTGTASCTTTDAISRIARPIFFTLNRFRFRVDGRHNLAGSVLIDKSAGGQRIG